MTDFELNKFENSGRDNDPSLTPYRYLFLKKSLFLYNTQVLKFKILIIKKISSKNSKTKFDNTILILENFVKCTFSVSGKSFLLK